MTKFLKKIYSLLKLNRLYIFRKMGTWYNSKYQENKLRQPVIYSHKKNNSGCQKKLCIFASFDTKSIIHDYVVYYISELFKLDCDIIFVSTAPNLPDSEIQKISQYLYSYIHRENIGYDFGSWKTGLFSVDYKQYDQIIFANDSVYGPIYSLGEIFQKMESKNYDMWGMTDSYEIHYHVQSYFIVYNQSIIKKEIFFELWNSIKFYSNEFKQFIIEKYEIGFSRELINKKYNIGAYCDFWELINEIVKNKDEVLNNFKLSFTQINPTLHLWRQSIYYLKTPFIKTELIKKNRTNEKILDLLYLINQLTLYDTHLIKKNLKNID